MNSTTRTVVSLSPEETRRLGETLAARLGGGVVLLLRGFLGAGKTVLARGIAAGLGARAWRGSPSFTIVNEYGTSPALYHADLYRLTAAEIGELGLEEYARPDSILMVEWPDHAGFDLGELASSQVVEIEILITGAHERAVTICQAGV